MTITRRTLLASAGALLTNPLAAKSPDATFVHVDAADVTFTPIGGAFTPLFIIYYNDTAGLAEHDLVDLKLIPGDDISPPPDQGTSPKAP